MLHTRQCSVCLTSMPEEGSPRAFGRSYAIVRFAAQPVCTPLLRLASDPPKMTSNAPSAMTRQASGWKYKPQAVRKAYTMNESGSHRAWHLAATSIQ